MGVGAGLYMCDVVKKVHVRYLISWWVLVLAAGDRMKSTLASYTMECAPFANSYSVQAGHAKLTDCGVWSAAARHSRQPLDRCITEQTKRPDTQSGSCVGYYYRGYAPFSYTTLETTWLCKLWAVEHDIICNTYTISMNTAYRIWKYLLL